MKKIFIILCIFILTGCTTSNEKIYNNYISYLKEIDDYTEYMPCDIEIINTKTSAKEVTYKVILDNPKEDMYKILKQ